MSTWLVANLTALLLLLSSLRNMSRKVTSWRLFWSRSVRTWSLTDWKYKTTLPSKRRSQVSVQAHGLRRRTRRTLAVITQFHLTRRHQWALRVPWELKRKMKTKRNDYLSSQTRKAQRRLSISLVVKNWTPNYFRWHKSPLHQPWSAKWAHHISKLRSANYKWKKTGAARNCRALSPVTTSLRTITIDSWPLARSMKSRRMMRIVRRILRIRAALITNLSCERQTAACRLQSDVFSPPTRTVGYLTVSQWSKAVWLTAFYRDNRKSRASKCVGPVRPLYRP